MHLLGTLPASSYPCLTSRKTARTLESSSLGSWRQKGRKESQADKWTPVGARAARTSDTRFPRSCLSPPGKLSGTSAGEVRPGTSALKTPVGGTRKGSKYSRPSYLRGPFLSSATYPPTTVCRSKSEHLPCTPRRAHVHTPACTLADVQAQVAGTQKPGSVCQEGRGS